MSEPDKGLGDRELLALYLEHFGLREGLRMFGWCILWGSMGIETWSDLQRAKPPRGVHETTWYRALAQFRGFRDAVAAAEGRAAGDGELARRVLHAVELEGPSIFASAAVD